MVWRWNYISLKFEIEITLQLFTLSLSTNNTSSVQDTEVLYQKFPTADKKYFNITINFYRDVLFLFVLRCQFPTEYSFTYLQSNDHQIEVTILIPFSAFMWFHLHSYKANVFAYMKKDNNNLIKRLWLECKWILTKRMWVMGLE